MVLGRDCRTGLRKALGRGAPVAPRRRFFFAIVLNEEPMSRSKSWCGKTCLTVVPDMLGEAVGASLARTNPSGLAGLQ